MDAFFHALESFTNKVYHPVGDMYALEAVKLIKKYLRKVYEDPYYEEGREKLALASTLAGYAIDFKRVGLEAKTYKDVVYAIREMLVRGAPAIGCVSAYGFVLGVKEGNDPEVVADELKSTRPTAVNLFWAVDRMKRAYEEGKDIEREAISIEREDYENNKKMGDLGSELIKNGALPHGNYPRRAYPISLLWIPVRECL